MRDPDHARVQRWSVFCTGAGGAVAREAGYTLAPVAAGSVSTQSLNRTATVVHRTLVHIYTHTHTHTHTLIHTPYYRR